MDPAVQDTLADLLCGLTDDLRKILDCPGLPEVARLSAVWSAVDERAPAPGPDDYRFSHLEPSPGSDAERLCDVITGVRVILAHTGMNARDKLAAIDDVLTYEGVLT